MNEIKLTIQLEVQTTGDSIVGTVSAPAQPAAQFSGWIGLISALDSLVDRSREEPLPLPTPPPHLDPAFPSPHLAR
jgi:hypothetical protein